MRNLLNDRTAQRIFLIFLLIRIPSSKGGKPLFPACFIFYLQESYSLLFTQTIYPYLSPEGAGLLYLFELRER
ncbi:hypothetical protein C2I18_26380 [Paenibacillus sp. PK3_47]|nr:hypothetical protein C2I18_26380 [Paenibacillus sp. PK3_47]